MGVEYRLERVGDTFLAAFSSTFLAALFVAFSDGGAVYLVFQMLA